MIVGYISTLITGTEFYFSLPFAFILHGVIITLIISGVWVMLFGLNKSWKFIVRYSLFLITLIILYVLSIFNPIMNSIAGYHLWLICSFIVVFGSMTGFSIANEKYFINKGERNVLIWEIS
jgi:hypothetical protein